MTHIYDGMTRGTKKAETFDARISTDKDPPLLVK